MENLVGVLNNPPHFIEERDWDYALGDSGPGFPIEFWSINLSVYWYEPEYADDGSIEVGALYETEIGGRWDATPTFSSRFLALKALQSITPDEFAGWCTNCEEGDCVFDGGFAEVTWFPKGATLAEGIAAKEFFFDKKLGGLNDHGVELSDVEGDVAPTVFNGGIDRLRVRHTEDGFKLYDSIPITLPGVGIPLE